MQNHVPLGHCLGFKWHGDSTSTISYSKMLYEEVWSIYSFQCPTKIKPWWTFNEAVSIALLYFSFLYSYSLVFPPNHRIQFHPWNPNVRPPLPFVVVITKESESIHWFRFMFRPFVPLPQPSSTSHALAAHGQGPQQQHCDWPVLVVLETGKNRTIGMF